MKQTKGKTMKSKTKLWISLAVISLAVILCGIMTQGFKDWNPYCWFGHKYNVQGVCVRCNKDKPAEEAKQPVTAVDDKGNALDSDKTYPMPKGLIFASAHALSDGTEQVSNPSVTVTATVDSLDEELSKLNWTITFKNASSEWATGKTLSDYVTLTVSEDTHSATIECLAEFGEPITITVTAVYAEDVTATCQVDYMKRVTSIDFTNTYKGNTSIRSVFLNYENKIVFKPTYGVGTITPTSDNFAVKNVKLKDNSSYAYTTIHNYIHNTLQAHEASAKREIVIENASLFTINPNDFFNRSSISESNYKLIWNKVIEELQHGAAKYVFDVTVELTYNGQVIQSETMTTEQFYISTSDAQPFAVVNSIDLSQSTVVM